MSNCQNKLSLPFFLLSNENKLFDFSNHFVTILYSFLIPYYLKELTHVICVPSISVKPRKKKKVFLFFLVIPPWRKLFFPQIGRRKRKCQWVMNQKTFLSLRRREDSYPGHGTIVFPPQLPRCERGEKWYQGRFGMKITRVFWL